MANRAEAGRLFSLLDQKLSELSNRLFESTEGELIGVDPIVAQHAIPSLVNEAGDLLNALTNLDPIANGFRSEVIAAITSARLQPFASVELPNSGVWLTQEEYRVMLEFPDLARRMATIYGLDQGVGSHLYFQEPQRLLIRMGQDVGRTIEHLVEKGIIKEPKRED